jgi:hypothetical protein
MVFPVDEENEVVHSAGSYPYARFGGTQPELRAQVVETRWHEFPIVSMAPCFIVNRWNKLDDRALGGPGRSQPPVIASSCALMAI